MAQVLTFLQLRDRLNELVSQRGPTVLDLEVVLRIQNDDSETMVGGLTAIDIDPGCTEIDCLMLDGDTEAESSAEELEED